MQLAQVSSGLSLVGNQPFAGNGDIFRWIRAAEVEAPELFEPRFRPMWLVSQNPRAGTLHQD